MQPFRLPPNLNQYPPSQPMFDKYGHPINPVIVQNPPPYPGQKTYYAVQPNIQYYPPAQPNSNPYIYNANNQIINNEQIIQNANAGRKPGPAHIEANAPVASSPYHVPNNVLPNTKEVINNPPNSADQNNGNAKNIQNDGNNSENLLQLKNQQSSGSNSSRNEVYVQNNQSPVPAEKPSPSTNQYSPSPNFIINNQTATVSPPMYAYYPAQNVYYQRAQPQTISQPQQPHIIGQPQPHNYVNPQAKPQNLAQIFGQPQIFSRNQPIPFANPQNPGQYQHPNPFIDNGFDGQGMKKKAVEKPSITVTGPEENIFRSGLRRTKSISDLENENKEDKMIVDEVIPDIKLMETAHFIKNSNLSEIEKKNYEEKFLALEKQLQIVRQQGAYWKQKFESTLKNEGEGLNRSGLNKSTSGADEILKLKEFLVGKNNECEEWKTKCEVLEKQLNENSKEVLESKNLELQHKITTLNNDLLNLNDLYQKQLNEYNSFREEYAKVEESLKNQGILKDDCLKLSKILNSKIQEAEEWKNRADKKENELKERNANMSENEKKLLMLMDEIDRLTNVLKLKMEENIKMSQIINTMNGKNYELNSWKEKHHVLSEEIDRLNQVINEKNAVIEEMTLKFKELVGKVRNDEMRKSQFLEEMKKTIDH